MNIPIPRSIRRKSIILPLVFALLFEAVYHVRLFHVPKPSKPLDGPFIVGCQEPDTSQPRENGVIVMLARNSDVEGAAQAIGTFEARFNQWFHYPIVFLNDQPWSERFVSQLTQTVTEGTSVKFEVIPRRMWSYPKWIDRKKAKKNMERMREDDIPYVELEGYHHMCRFNSGMFYDHPALKHYKWYWRIEPDIEFSCTITYDPFRHMAHHNKTYGYTIPLWEVGATSPTLFRTVSDYKTSKRIPSRDIWKSMIDSSYVPWPLRPLMRFVQHRNADGDAWNFCHYWSNFEIADMDFFRGREYREFFQHLDEKGGFYYERWGDAPIHSIAAALFLDPHQLHHFSDFGYDHPPFQTCPANAAGKQLLDSGILNKPFKNKLWGQFYDPLQNPGPPPQLSALGRTAPKLANVADGRASPLSFTKDPKTKQPRWAWNREEEGGVGCRCQCDPTEGWYQGECTKRLERPLGDWTQTVGREL